MQLSTAVRCGPASSRSAASSSGVAGTGMRVPASRPGRKAAGGYIPFMVGEHEQLGVGDVVAPVGVHVGQQRVE